MSVSIQQRLRDMCEKLRRTPMPISDIIPLLQEAADTIDSDADDVTFLNCLLNAGVDNWDWYDEAVSEYHASMASDQNIVGSA